MMTLTIQEMIDMTIAPKMQANSPARASLAPT